MLPVSCQPTDDLGFTDGRRQGRPAGDRHHWDAVLIALEQADILLDVDLDDPQGEARREPFEQIGGILAKVAARPHIQRDLASCRSIHRYAPLRAGGEHRTYYSRTASCLPSCLQRFGMIHKPLRPFYAII